MSRLRRLVQVALVLACTGLPAATASTSPVPSHPSTTAPSGGTPRVRLAVSAADEVPYAHLATVRLRVTNRSARTLSDVSVRVRGDHGVQPTKKTLMIGTLGAGRSWHKLLRIRPDARSLSFAYASVLAGKRTLATSPIVLEVEPSTLPEPLQGRTFVEKTSATSPQGWFFKDAMASQDFTSKRLPDCATGSPCTPYSYDSATGAITIGDLSGSLTAGTLTIGGVVYEEAARQPVGARYRLSWHTNDVQCTDTNPPACSGSLQDLTLKRDGTFDYVESYPDEVPRWHVRGDYRVISGSRMVWRRTTDGTWRPVLWLLFADGSVLWGNEVL